MKSLILKDIYNIRHNVRQLVLLLIFLAVCLVPSTSAEGFVVTAAIICSMMSITTFAFDERCKWEKYAKIMPVTDREYVLSKYLSGLIFGGCGVGAGIVLACIAGAFKQELDLAALLGCTIAGLLFVLLESSLMIPMIIRFGTEKARLVMLGAVGIPVLLAFAAYKVIELTGIALTSEMIMTVFVVFAVLILLVFPLISYRLSVKWYREKEF